MHSKLIQQLLMVSKYVVFGTVIQVILLNIVFASPSSGQIAQSVKEVELRIGFENNNLKEVFSAIEAETDFDFVYHKNDPFLYERISLPKQKITVEALLLYISKNSGLSFKQVNNNISVQKQTEKVEQPKIEITIEERTITGKVTDDLGEPLPGATVMVKGTSIGTITDIDGNYKLDVAENIEPVTLIFSYVGYLPEEIVIGNSQVIVDMSLVSDILSLQELVVVGYGTQEKKDVTGAVSTIQAEALGRTTSTTVSGAVVGKVAGITYRQKSGQPGSGTALQIRNFGTPLYVIDGVMKDEGQFNNLDVNDIESVAILKDGAAAIYGVKAANGVVLVTTKKGKRNQAPTVSVNTYRGWQQWTSYPDMLDPYQWNYANYMKDVNNGTLAVTPEFAKAELEKWRTGYYNPETGEDYRGFNWYDEYVNKAAPQTYVQANVSGGGEKTNYYVSLSHIDQDAVFKDFNFNRTNIQTNFDAQLNDRFKIGMQVSGRIETRDNPGMPGTDDYETVRAALFELAPIYRPYANDNPLYLNAVPGRHGQNLAAMTKEHAGEFKQDWRVLQANWDVEYKTGLKGLVAKGLFSYYYANNETHNFEKGWQEYTYDRANDQYNLAYDKSAAGETFLNKVRESNEDLTGQATLNYDNTFGDHHITGVGGFEFFQHSWKYLQLQQNPVENEFIELLSTNENNTVNDNARTISTASFLFRAGYSFKEKYILQFAGRYDGSWKFPETKRWGFFPSVSAAWRLSEENFFQGSSVSNWLANAKLRVSYGEMGDDNLGEAYPDFAYLPGYSYYQGSALIAPNPWNSSESKKIVGASAKGVPITGLSWMTSAITNIGLDLGFLNNRLSVEVDVFKRVREGIPAVPNDIQFPLETGLGVLPQNLNSDATMGVDGYIRWNERIGDLNYFVGVNATLARQKNIDRYGQTFLNAWDQYRWSEQNRWSNVSSGEIWMYETIGVFQTQEEIDNYPVIIDGNNNTNLVPGDLIFKDVNGDGVINGFDERPLGYSSADWPWDSSKGNKNPLMTLGINFGLEWKGIDFAADFAGGFMNTYVADWLVKWGVDRGSNGYVYNSLDVWHHEDILDPTSPWVSGKFPALRDGNASTRWWNDFYTKEVNYLRLRNVVLGYTLPKQWTSVVSVENFRVYFQGTNLFYVFNSLKDYGFDPEISTVNGQDYPQHKVYTVGLNITF